MGRAREILLGELPSGPAAETLGPVPAFRFAPGADTWWAFATIPLMWAAYWGNGQLQSNPVAALAVYFVLGNLIICTLIPAWVVSRLRREGAPGLGFTRFRLGIALLVSAVLGLGSLPYYFMIASASGVDPVQHLAYNLVILWEPLFVYGWLLLRFRRAFGWLPGILLAALGFTTYHVGSVPPITLATFLVTGLVFSAIMAGIRNLWVMFPLASGVSSAIGTVQSGLAFDWETALVGLVVLAVQALLLWLLLRRRQAAPDQPSPRA